MWPTFKTEFPVKETEVLDGDLRLATLAFGFTIGFGYFVGWHAIKQTKRIRRRSAYIIMCWLEFLACSALAIICWLHLCDVIGHSFWLYFFIVTLWALQLQFLLQIIVSRICILLPNASQRFWLKTIVAVWITAISISVYCIWIPAKLQISETYIRLNWYWDRIEKCLYLLTDAALNFMFIRIIRQRLVSRGLKKYDKLVAFNLRIIFVSLSMDIIIIGMLSYRNDLVYLQFHPVAFMVKLEIEMCMSRLILKVARGTGLTIYESPDLETPDDSGAPQSGDVYTSGRGVNVHVTTQVVTHTDNLGADYDSSHEPEDHDHKLPSLDEADLEGQFRLNQLDPLSKDGREIAGITNGARGTDDSTQWASRGRIDSPSSRDSESTFKAT